MHKFLKMMAKLVMAAQILAISLLAACTPSTIITFCHATGNPANPYEEITITRAQLNEYIRQPNNIYPVPANGCPTSPLAVSDGMITICHATGSQPGPYNEITVAINGLNGHGTHVGDIIPAPVDGCPASPVVISDANITICHATGDAVNPYEEITVTSAQLDEHTGHPNDITPAPANGCPTSPVVISDGKITICHATGSETNPYDEITVSVKGLNGHDKHAGDIIPAPEAGCPTSPLVITDGKVTICHATSSETNPYNEITVSVNGLNGHDKHAGDIIPAPVGGCPTSQVGITDGKITICHVTGSVTHPYNEIKVSVNGLNGHSTHAGDIIPAPAGGCPTSKP